MGSNYSKKSSNIWKSLKKPFQKSTQNSNEVDSTTKSDVPLGIFWDIETCSIPRKRSAPSVVYRIRQFVADKHRECGYATEFYCVCDSHQLGRRHHNDLSKSGVSVQHVDPGFKHNRLQALMTVFADKYRTDGAVLVLITADVELAEGVANIRRNGIHVVLIQGVRHSPDLKDSANEYYVCNQLISRSAGNVAENSITKPVVPINHDIKTNISAKPIKITAEVHNDDTDNSVTKPEVPLTSGTKTNKCEKKHKIKAEVHNNDLDNCINKSVVTRPVIITNEGDKQGKLVIDVKSTNNNDCKSVVTLSADRKRANEIWVQVIRRLVDSWGDSQITGHLIKSVAAIDSKVPIGEGMQRLLVVATSAEGSAMLVKGANYYSETEDHIKWKKYRPSHRNSGPKPLKTNSSG